MEDILIEIKKEFHLIKKCGIQLPQNDQEGMKQMMNNSNNFNYIYQIIVILSTIITGYILAEQFVLIYIISLITFKLLKTYWEWMKIFYEKNLMFEWMLCIISAIPFWIYLFIYKKGALYLFIETNVVSILISSHAMAAKEKEKKKQK